MFIISAYPESVNNFFLFFKKNLFLCIFQDAPSVLPQNLIFTPLYHTFLCFCIAILPFYARILPLLPPKHRLRNRNFSLLLCKITLKMHKNKFFCIRHFTLFEQICYKSRKNIKLYLCFLQIILYIYSHFCKIMPYYARLLYPPRPPPCLDKRILIYARTRMHAQYIHTHNCTCARTRSIYIWGFWSNCLARIYKYGYWRCKR